MSNDDSLPPIEPSNFSEPSGDIERVEPQRIESLIKDVEELKELKEILSQEITHIKTVESRMEYSGPIPPPEVFRGYEEVLPGSADRILKMTEEQLKHRILSESKQLEHRIASETKLINTEAKLSYWGLISGFVIAFVGLSGAVYLGIKDKPIPSSIMSAGTLASLVSVFVSGRSIIKRESSQEPPDNNSTDEPPENSNG